MPESGFTDFSGLWMKAGSTFSAAQQRILKDITERMGSFFALPLQAVAAQNPNLEEASENLRKFAESSYRLSEALAPLAANAGEGGSATLGLLGKIFDPREWLAATGLMDENVRLLAEGPKLADLGQMERKFFVLMKAWSELRTQSARHTVHVLEAWSKAANEFASKLNEVVSKGGSLGSRADTVDLWVEIANRHLLAMQRSAPYLETQRELLRASSELRIAQRDLGNTYNELLGMPTRSEIDDLSRTVAELKREVRADKRRRESAAGVARKK